MVIHTPAPPSPHARASRRRNGGAAAARRCMPPPPAPPLLLALCCCAALLLLGAQAQLRRDRVLRGPQLRLKDYVMVICTTEERLPLIHATRRLRLRVRTFIAMGSQQLVESLSSSQDALDHLETYVHYPDRESGSRRWESRYVAAPFLAHEFYGDTYKWMLIGDDDTLWFLSGLKRLLLRFDPAIPYYISDNVVDYIFQPSNFTRHAQHLFMGGPPGLSHKFLRPSWLGTTCLPCHSVQAEARLRERFRRTPLESHQWLGCPCTNLEACHYRRNMCAYQQISDRRFCTGKWDERRAGLCTFSWPWGGTGMVTSLGLMQRLTWAGSMRGTVEKHLARPQFDAHAGDWMLSLVLYDAADGSGAPGYGITLPPYSAMIKGEVLHNDLIVFGPVTRRAQSIIRTPAAWLHNGSCDTDCMWVIRHAVSHHASVNVEFKGSVSKAVQGIQDIASSHRAALLQLGEPVEHLDAPLDGDPTPW